LQELISEGEQALAERPTLQLRYRLAGAILVHVFFHIRGDARSPWLGRAAALLREALEEAERLGPKSVVPLSEIRALLSRLLVEAPAVRDLATAEKELRATWNETREYRPEFCSLVSAVYKQGRYAEAAELALELHQRATKDSDWSDNPPPAPLQLAVTALRAEVRRLKKANDPRAALAVSERLCRLPDASDNDRKILERLRAESSTTG
jgi:hypothetical protein